ncbi:MAG: nitroreductase [Desulfobacterales bacterium]|nr:nitroreductase [Desulfobacterales bacterium]
MDLLEAIYTRRSIREYTDQPVEGERLTEIIKAGTWAPSGLNNQPWRFVILRDKHVRFELASLTKYHKIIENSPACIAVFIDRNAMYNEVKDHQAMGACIQNMLLAAHALGLGAVWLGEILKNADKVRALLQLPEEMDLMSVVAVGYPADRNQRSHRKEVSEVLIKEL